MQARGDAHTSHVLDNALSSVFARLSAAKAPLMDEIDAKVRKLYDIQERLGKGVCVLRVWGGHVHTCVLGAGVRDCVEGGGQDDKRDCGAQEEL